MRFKDNGQKRIFIYILTLLHMWPRLPQTKSITGKLSIQCAAFLLLQRSVVSRFWSHKAGIPLKIHATCMHTVVQSACIRNLGPTSLEYSASVSASTPMACMGSACSLHAGCMQAASRMCAAEIYQTPSWFTLVYTYSERLKNLSLTSLELRRLYWT